MATADDPSPTRVRNLFADVAIGDWIVPSDDGERVDHVVERTSAFTRRASFEGDRFVSDTLAANIDSVFLVHALGKPPNQRRLERELITAYEKDVAAVLAALSPVTLDTAIELLSLPDRVRGYGPVKEKAAQDAKARHAQLVADLANPPPAPRQIAAE